MFSHLIKFRNILSKPKTDKKRQISPIFSAYFATLQIILGAIKANPVHRWCQRSIKQKKSISKSSSYTRLSIVIFLIQLVHLKQTFIKSIHKQIRKPYIINIYTEFLIPTYLCKSTDDICYANTWKSINQRRIILLWHYHLTSN